MPASLRIDIHHLTRVEGHGDLQAEIANGQIQKVRFAVVEAPRFFEHIVQGHGYQEVAHIASRICGICSVSHKSVAIQALEAALAATISEQDYWLRQIAFHGEIIGSHMLHVNFLVAPDFLGAPSALHLEDTLPDWLPRAMRLKKLGYDLSAAVVGRHTHPVSMIVGGFSAAPDLVLLGQKRADLEQGLLDLRETARVYRTFPIPEFVRETEYLSLQRPDRYALYDGEICSSRGERMAPARYREMIEEYEVPHSAALYARRAQEYMVGALARVNNNHDQLHPVALELADELELHFPCHNPFKITLAQIVESAHCMQDSIQLIDRLLERGGQRDGFSGSIEPRAGTGVAAVEAPRGTLFHEYTLDDEGKCQGANMIIPTAQNLANLEADLNALAAAWLAVEGQGAVPLEQALCWLVRAYDPCISCSTH